MGDSETATKSVKPKGIASGMGFDKEVSQPHGPKQKGMKPIVNSHTAKPHRKIRVGKLAT